MGLTKEKNLREKQVKQQSGVLDYLRRTYREEKAKMGRIAGE